MMSTANASHDRGGTRGHSTSSKNTRELIQEDQDRQRLRNLLLDGAALSPTTTADAEYFDRLRDACPHGNAHAADGGEIRRLGGVFASCVEDGQPRLLRVDDDPDRHR